MEFKPNGHVIAVISSGAAYQANDNKSSTTELDSHANMVVVGGNATAIQETEQFAYVNVFANKVSQNKKDPNQGYGCDI